MKTPKILLSTLLITLLLTSLSFADDAEQLILKEVTQEPYPDTSNVQASDVDKNLISEVEQEPLKYTLGLDDVIQIDVRRHPEFSGEFVVNSEGKIQYKFVGDIPIAGLNKVELKEKLKNILSKFIVEPDIEVTILEYRSKVIYIVGEVGAPGKYYMMSDSISVKEAVVQAGLPTLAAAMRRTRLIHPDKNGRPKKERVDLYKLVYEGKLELDREMRSGDILYVPATIFAKIGRILSPIAAPVGPAYTIDGVATNGLDRRDRRHR